MPSVDREPTIIMEHVTLDFGRVRALDDVGLQVPPGSITGLIGRNGAGKSTAIRCFAGLLAPSGDSASVRILGFSSRADRRIVVAKTGFLLSEPALFPYLTPVEMLQFLGRAHGLDRTESRLRAFDLISFFDLTDAAERLADAFSTGMRKRLALAAATIHAPSVLVLDEPFESLDPLMVRSLKKLLIQYAKGGGTVLLSSHLIDAVEEICDRIVILEQGRVVAAGTTEDVMASIADRLPAATLEDLYASLVPGGELPQLTWLTDRA